MEVGVTILAPAGAAQTQQRTRVDNAGVRICLDG